MGAGLISLSLIFILSLLGFSIQRRTNRVHPTIDSKKLFIKSHGALTLDFNDSKVKRESQLIALPDSEQDLLIMNFKSALFQKDKQEQIQINITIPIKDSGGLPALGEYLFYNHDGNQVNGGATYTISKNNKSQMHADYHFRLKTLILRIEESGEKGLTANILMTANQIAGSKKAFGNGEEIKLANNGHLQIHASFAAPVYNQAKVQKQELI